MAALLLTFAPQDAAALEVRDIRFGQHPDKTRLVIDLDQASDYRVFMASDPFRLMVDLPDFDWKVGAVSKPPGSFVSDVRQGQVQPGTSRIVMELSQPATVKSVFFLPRNQGLPDRLVIDYGKANAEEVAARLGKSYGKLAAVTAAAPQAAPMAVAEASPAAHPAPSARIASHSDHPDNVSDRMAAGQAPRPPSASASGTDTYGHAAQAYSENAPQILGTLRFGGPGTSPPRKPQIAGQAYATAPAHAAPSQPHHESPSHTLGSLSRHEPAAAHGAAYSPPPRENRENAQAMTDTPPRPVPGMVLPVPKPERIFFNDAPAASSQYAGIDAPSYTPPPTAASAPVAAPVPVRSTPSQKPMIVIDAGHGGIDPGAVGAGGLKEKAITLAMAQELKRQLENSGRYRVTMTRNNDTYLRLGQRVSIARKAKADLFISLHADSIGRADVSGASIYTLSEKSSDAQTEKLAMRENRADLIAGVDLSAEDEVVVNILVDLTMRDTMNQSKFFANTAVEALSRHNIRILENPHRYAGFAVLKAPDVPSVLVEMGFMSNRQEAQMMNQPAFRSRMGEALVRSIDAYFEKVAENNKS